MTTKQMATDCIRRVREEIARGDFYAALSSIRGLENSAPLQTNSDPLSDPPLASPTSETTSTCLNTTQRLRLHLLKADCYSSLGSHTKALESAKLALELSHALSPQAMFVCGRESLKLGQLREALEYFEGGETLIQTGLGVAEGAVDGASTAGKRGESSDAVAARRRAAWAAIGEDPQTAPPGFPPPTEVTSATSLAVEKEGGAPTQSGREVAVSQPLQPQQASTPLVPSFEWAQELVVWRQLHAEAKLLFVMQETHVVPSRLLTQAVAYAGKQGGTRSHGVIVVRNVTKGALIYNYNVLDNCELIGGFSFAERIAPGEVCVAVVCYTGWASGGRVAVSYRNAASNATAVFLLDAPLLTQSTAGGYFRAERPPKGDGGSPSRQRSTADAATIEADLSSIKLKARPSASDDFVCGSGSSKVRYKAVVSSTGRVTSFCVMEVQPQTLNDTELMSVLEFLPPQSLRHVAAASWHVRECVSRLAPPHFFTPPRSNAADSSSMPWFPNYLLCADVVNNPWVVHDGAPQLAAGEDGLNSRVIWRMVFDGLNGSDEEYAFVDSSDNRVLTISLEVQGSSRFHALVYYGGGRRRQLVSKITESWNPFSRTTTWKMNNGRRLGSIAISSQEVSVQSDAMPSDTPILTMRRAPEAPSTASSTLVTAKGAPSSASMQSTAVLLFYSTQSMPTSPPVAELKYSRRQVLSATRRGDVVGELTLGYGCDAFLVSVLGAFGRVKWAAVATK